MTYKCNLFKQSDIEKQNNYTEFNNMRDSTSLDNEVQSFEITYNKKCPLKKWNCKRNELCNISAICNKLDKIIDSLLIITIHIFFISIFEPLFYLNYVVTLEYNFIMSKITDETNILYQQYMTYSTTNRQFIDTVILGDKYNTLQKLELEKNKAVSFKILQRDSLYIQGIIYSASILGFILLMCVYKYVRKGHIQFCRILLENIVMILFLFIYEYIFFNNFIMKYDTIDTAEINYYGLLNFINYTTFHPNAFIQ